ncbi:hypothetical protein HGA88_01760 [Candidatus Roizmanbacteria bacterium]|nr:hypothetical protein [Candidatus Roizmanbacteria bacterium]
MKSTVQLKEMISKLTNDQLLFPQLKLDSDSPSKFGAANILSPTNVNIPEVLTRNDPIEFLSLPIRLENALRKHGSITTIGEFCDTPEDKLRKIWAVGSKSVKYMLLTQHLIKEKLNNVGKKNPICVNTIKSYQELVIPDDQLILKLLSRCGDDRARKIISTRYGLLNGERQTLEEIGESYGLTRERIRQIQNKALGRMNHPANSLKKQLIEIIEKLLYKNDGLISSEEADIVVPQVLGHIDQDGSSILDLLSDLGWIQNYEIGDILIYSPLIDGVLLSKLSEEIYSVIQTEDLGISIQSISNEVRLLSRITDKRFNKNKFIQKYCKADPRIDKIDMPSGDSEIIFRHYSHGHFSKKAWIALIKKVLEDEQMPLHFTEIVNKVNELISKSERQLDVRRGHSILIEDKTFAHSGVLGTYGLTSWGFRKELTPQLIIECIKKAGFPLHWKQIYDYVSKYKNTKPANIISCLETNKLFKKISNGLYWLSENNETTITPL